MSSQNSEKALPNTVTLRVTLRANCCSNRRGWFRLTNRKSLRTSNKHAVQRGFDVSAIGDLAFDVDQERNTITVLRQIDPGKFDYSHHGNPGFIVTCKKCGKVTCHIYDWSVWHTVRPNRDYRNRVDLRWDNELPHNQRTLRNLKSVGYYTSAYTEGYDRRHVDCMSKIPPELLSHGSSQSYSHAQVHIGLIDEFWQAYCFSKTPADFNAKFNMWSVKMANVFLRALIEVQVTRARAEKRCEALATATRDAAVAIHGLKGSIQSRKLQAVRTQLEKALNDAGYCKIDYN